MLIDELIWSLSRMESGRPLLEAHPRLDIRWLQREGALDRPTRIEWGACAAGELCRSGADLFISHRPRTLEQALEDRVALAWTPCYFGGARPWFLCPGCSRRVAVLYAFPRFRCRLCHPVLRYASSVHAPHNRPRAVIPTLMIPGKARRN